MAIDWDYYRNERETLPPAHMLLTAIDQGEEFPGWVIKNIRWDYLVEEETVDAAKRGRWSICRSAIVTFGEDRYFRIAWDEGLTEYQEDMYFDQLPQEVFKVKKIIELYGWDEAPEEQK